MSKTRLCRPSLLSSKPCRDYTAAASIRDLLQRDNSLPPDITDNLERCAAALEKAAVAAGVTLSSAAHSQQFVTQKQQQLKSRPARQAQPELAAAADGSGPEKLKASALAAAATLPDVSAGAAAGEGAHQGKRKKAKRKPEQSAAVAAGAAPDMPAQPGAAQPAGMPVTDATKPLTSQSGKKRRKRHVAEGTDAADGSTADRSSEQAAAARGTLGGAAAAEVQTPAASRKKRKKEAAGAFEQQNGQAAHGSVVADVQQAVNGSMGKKHKKRKEAGP